MVSAQANQWGRNIRVVDPSAIDDISIELKDLTLVQEMLVAGRRV